MSTAAKASAFKGKGPEGTAAHCEASLTHCPGAAGLGLYSFEVQAKQARDRCKSHARRCSAWCRGLLSGWQRLAGLGKGGLGGLGGAAGKSNSRLFWVSPRTPPAKRSGVGRRQGFSRSPGHGQGAVPEKAKLFRPFAPACSARSSCCPTAPSRTLAHPNMHTVTHTHNPHLQHGPAM